MNWILLILGLNIIVLVVIYILLCMRIDRAFRSTELLSQIELEIDKTIAELNQTTERNITLVEDRIRNLEALLEKSDKKVILMNRELEKSREPVVYKRPRIPRPVQINQDTKNLGNTEQNSVDIPPDRPEPGGDESPVRVDFGRSGKSHNPVPPKTSKEKVLDLYERGDDVNTIASKLNITLGEIELILSMNQRQTSER